MENLSYWNCDLMKIWLLMLAVIALSYSYGNAEILESIPELRADIGNFIAESIFAPSKVQPWLHILSS